MTYPVVTRLPLKWGNHNVFQYKYVGRYNRRRIQNIAQKLSNELYDKDEAQKVMISMEYPKGWRSAKYSDVGESVKLYTDTDYYEDEEDPEYYKEFRVYVLHDPERAGGCNGQFNDCLHDCIERMIPRWEWKGAELKTALGLKREDKISVDQCAKVDGLLPDGWKLNVSGDHIYTSIKKALREINVQLVNGHYTLLNPVLHVPGVATEIKRPLIYEIFPKFVRTYDGIQQIAISKQTYMGHKANPRTSDFTLIPVDKKLGLEKTYEQWTKDALILAKSDVLPFSMYETGTYAKTALKLFYGMVRGIPVEPIRQDEALWIENAKIGALIFAKAYEGKAYEYDFVSHYPSIMADSRMHFPIKRGEFKRLTKVEFDLLLFYSPGIFRVEITGKHKHFKFNNVNYYTHIDVTRAKKLGLNVRLIEDGKPNYLYYSRDKLLTGSQLFGEYVGKVFKIKQEVGKTLECGKTLLNILWGALSQKNEYSHTVKEDDQVDTQIPENTQPPIFQPVGNGEIRYKYVKNETIYDSPYARIAPFLLAKGREKIGKALESFGNHVVRCHTDSITTTKRPSFVITGSELGDLKYKGYCPNVEVFNCNKMVGEFN